MERLTVESPASWIDCLTCAGGLALARKWAIAMRGRGETCAVFAGGELLAVVYLVPDHAGRLEFCLSVSLAARSRMLALCRLAHSTLAAARENGAVVICRVTPGNRSGERMARLTGFRPDAGEYWIFGGGDGQGGEGSFWRCRRQREEGSGAEPGFAAGGE